MKLGDLAAEKARCRALERKLQALNTQIEMVRQAKPHDAEQAIRWLADFQLTYQTGEVTWTNRLRVIIADRCKLPWLQRTLLNWFEPLPHPLDVGAYLPRN